MPRNDFVLMLDLECTGKDDWEEIVEIGIVLLETQTWTERGFYTSVVRPSREAYDRMMANETVRNMHAVSGLLPDIEDLMSNDPEEYNITAIDNEVVHFLNNAIDMSTVHIPYGGSGVSWYDRKFIKLWMPKFNKRITHFALDVGPIKRAAEYAGRTDWPVDERNHRALVDARFHADEWRFALKVLAP